MHTIKMHTVHTTTSMEAPTLQIVNVLNFSLTSCMALSVTSVIESISKVIGNPNNAAINASLPLTNSLSLLNN